MSKRAKLFKHFKASSTEVLNTLIEMRKLPEADLKWLNEKMELWEKEAEELMDKAEEHEQTK